MAANHVVAAGNFLVPDATFIAELISFLIILGILGRYVLPYVQKATRERQEMIRKGVEDADEAARKLADAERRYQEALTEARTEAAQIRENARAEAQRTVEELRAQARDEQARIIARGEEMLAHQRERIVRDLRGEIGTLAVELSEKILEKRLADDAEVSATVDAFLAGLESQEKVAKQA